MRKILLLSLCLLFAGSMFNQTSAVPAYPKPIKFTQADGTTVTLIMRGDEHSKWAQTTDGYTLLYNAKGEFEYAVVDNKGDAVPSGVRASDVARRKSNETALLQNTRKGITFSESQVSMIKQIKQMRAQQNAQQRAFPTTGARKLVCILMGYKDKAFTKTQVDINNLFNQVGYSAGGATGSVKDYYNENSWNQFNLTVTVAGPFTASQNMSYYGANDASGNDVKPRELVTEAVNAADATVNFADFDNDGDGAVDGVYVLFAGYGEEAGASANCIWSHAWNITTLTKDGKTISKYSCSPELMGTSGTTLTGIGVICHEFGHVLGAPDYYDTNYSTGGQFDGTGDWDMMAAGSWNNNGLTPAHHNAYSKVKVYGWATATVLSSATNVTVNPVIGNQSFYQINSTTSGEYWLIENRQQTGFDAYLPGHGMMIYHVHSGVASASTSNNINATYPQKMYPVCASATSNPGSTAATYGTVNGAGCPFPGTGAKTSFTDATTPNMKSWAGANTTSPITGIVENADKTISFVFKGGVVNPTAPAATTSAASAISTTGATLNGSVTANNATTTVTFEYGTTTSYGTSVNASPASVTGATATAVSVALTGLANNTTYYYRVKAVNSVGTTYGAQQSFTTSSNPTSLTLPVTENFGSSTLPAGWVTQNVGTGITERWSMSNTANAGGAAYELKCTYQNLSPATTRVITPAINTVGVAQVTLSFKHMFDDYAAGATLRIQSSTDKVNWTNEAWSLASTSNTNVGPVTVNTTIANNLNSATTYIAFVVDGNLYQIDNWYIDNVAISAGTASTVPTVTTSSVSGITASAATCGGNITADGGSSVTARGICYSTSANPTTANSTVASGTGTGSFTANLSGLAANTTYYVRAYATNANGTSYGAQQSFTTTTTTITYCTSKGNSVADEWIDLVQFAGINRTSGAEAGYKDNTSLVGTVARGSSVSIYLSAGFSGTAYTEYFAVWIDFNQNGTFDTDEKVASGSSKLATTLTYTVAVPSTALLGNTRMRVSMKYNAAPTACEAFSYGEVEDYTVNVTAAAGAPGIENPFATQLGNEEPSSFTVFPNPASSQVKIQLNGIEGDVMMRIYDMRGGLVKVMPVNGETDVDVSDLAKGVYVISIDEEKEAIKKQFVKL